MKKRDRQITESVLSLILLVGLLLGVAYLVTELQMPPPPTPKQRAWARAEKAPMPRQLNVVRILKVDGKYIREDTRKTIVWMRIGGKVILPEYDVSPFIDVPRGAAGIERAWLDCVPGVTKLVWSD